MKVEKIQKAFEVERAKKGIIYDSIWGKPYLPKSLVEELLEELLKEPTMKVEKIKKEFEPVMITLSSQHEVDAIINALEIIRSQGFSLNPQNGIIWKQLLELLKE